MNFGNMKEGDIAGLAVFQNPYAYVGIKKVDSKSYVVMVNNGNTIDSSEVNDSTIYLRASAVHGSGAAQYYDKNIAPGTGTASFSFSTDNKKFIPIGNVFNMKFSLKVFTGNKFCLFNYATETLGGYVDFDWFRTQAGMPNRREL